MVGLLLDVAPRVPDRPDTAGVPDEVAALRAENGRLREVNERLRVLLEDKDAKIADLEKRLARVERLLSRNSATPGCRRVPMICRGKHRRA